MQFGQFVIICGHYGCGKTNFALNLAVDAVKRGEKVTLVDLDLVNPYFRSSDYEDLLHQHGISLIAPVFAHSNLDLPALPARLQSIFAMPDQTVILDVGGDDAGATALGGLSAKIREHGAYQMLYLVNRYRALTTQSEQAVELLGEIERASRLRATAVVNNSHLQQQTASRDILEALPYGRQVAQQLGLPLAATTTPVALAQELQGQVENLYPVTRYVRPVWETDGQDAQPGKGGAV